MTAVNTAPGGGTTPLVAAARRGKIHDVAKNPDKPTHLLYLETTGSGGEAVTKTSNFLGWGAKVGIIGGVEVAYLLSSATEEYQDSGTHASMGSAGLRLRLPVVAAEADVSAPSHDSLDQRLVG